MNPSNRTLVHRKSTRQEGWDQIESAIYTTILLIGIVLFLRLFIRDLFDNLLTFPWICLIVFWPILCCLMLVQAWVFIRKNAEFVCALNAERFICHSPFNWYGESFNIKLQDIDRIQIRRFDGSKSYYLWDVQQQQYELTLNYDNPREDFFELLLELRPELKERFEDR